MSIDDLQRPSGLQMFAHIFSYVLAVKTHDLLSSHPASAAFYLTCFLCSISYRLSVICVHVCIDTRGGGRGEGRGPVVGGLFLYVLSVIVIVLLVSSSAGRRAVRNC